MIVTFPYHLLKSSYSVVEFSSGELNYANYFFELDNSKKKYHIKYSQLLIRSICSFRCASMVCLKLIRMVITSIVLLI